MEDKFRPTLLPAPEGARSTVPRVLYRRFELREHAENFVRRGEIRFRSLAHYRSVEDAARRDAREGMTHVEDATGITLSIAPVGRRTMVRR